MKKFIKNYWWLIAIAAFLWWRKNKGEKKGNETSLEEKIKQLPHTKPNEPLTLTYQGKTYYEGETNGQSCQRCGSPLVATRHRVLTYTSGIPTPTGTAERLSFICSNPNCVLHDIFPC